MHRRVVGADAAPEATASETHVRTAQRSENPPADAVLEVVEESAPDIEAGGTVEIEDDEAPRHTAPPESGSQVAQTEEAHDPSGKWGDASASFTQEPR